MENKFDRNDLIYKTNNKKKDKTYDSQKLKTIGSFGREIYNNDLSLDDALKQQIRLKNDIDIFKIFTKPKGSVKKKEQASLKNVIILLNGRQKAPNAFKSPTVRSLVISISKYYLLNKCFKDYQYLLRK